ncbi:MAG: IclR family transcriptional regulator [Nocardia sp.]|uniref:IclR family transcriptional regulator n=1 Tax=Nocardia sp. TaxID=1821 RepID=UPI00260CCB0E|nr:IclR family transcriptional regulator [Nocardia sp.]MCU1640715.1 IclR family transcriptional regulator [Nocardia sp.]
MQVVVRALRVLSALSTKGGGVTLQELHEDLDIPVGSLHRVLSILMQENFITRSPANKRYFIGPAARRLGEAASRQTQLLITPHRAVVKAAQVSGETIFLTELIGARAVCVALVEGRHPLRLFVRIGQDMPLHAAASSRALLAYLPTADARKLLQAYPLDAFTPETPTTVDEVIEHLEVVRERGYDICDDELDRGVWAVSAPVFASTGSAAASVTLAAAGGRIQDPAAREAAVQTVLAAAREMSTELGFAGEDVVDPDE